MFHNRLTSASLSGPVALAVHRLQSHPYLKGSLVKRTITIAASAALAITLAACGSSSASSKNSSASAGSASPSSAGVAEATKLVQQAEQTPTAILQTTPLKTAAPKGKSVIFLDNGNTSTEE